MLLHPVDGDLHRRLGVWALLPFSSITRNSTKRKNG
jgi:hypothetical protein